MAIALEQVPMWLVLGGLGHAIASTGNGWHHAACGLATPNGALTKETPERICRSCRRILKILQTGD